MADSAQYDPAVRQQGREKAKMLTHHDETVAQALAVALFGEAAHQIISQHQTCIDCAPALLQNTDTPVVVGAEVIRAVGRGEAATGHERLVDNQHATQIIAPMEAGGQAAGAELAHHAGG